MSGAYEGVGRLLMVGCGNMGGAMLGRWLGDGLDPARVTVVSPSLRAMQPGITVLDAVPPAAAAQFDTVLLALKPQQLGSLRQARFADHAPRLLMSILAGVEVAVLDSLCRADAVVRAMPNLPVAIGRGVVALHSTSQDAEARARAEHLVQSLGHAEWIADEAQFDVVTALAGSGPAFLYRFIDALAAGGTALGLPADQAERLALATVEGSALLAAKADAAPGLLADRVASKGGSTREGLNVLDRDDALRRLVAEMLAAATRRNREMAAAARA